MVETSSFGASYDSELHVGCSRCTFYCIDTFSVTRIPASCRPSCNLTLCRPSTVTLVSVGVFDSFRTNTSILAFSNSNQCGCMVATRPIATGKIRILWSNHPLSLSQIPFSGDFRPYFTMHDTEKQALINKLQPPPGLVLGTTNPFVYEECRHWPHTLSLGWGDAM